MTDEQLVQRIEATKKQANKPDEKWYYKITDNKTSESVYVSASLPIKPDKLLLVLGIEKDLEDVTVIAVSKEEFETKSE